MVIDSSERISISRKGKGRPQFGFKGKRPLPPRYARPVVQAKAFPSRNPPSRFGLPIPLSRPTRGSVPQPNRGAIPQPTRGSVPSPNRGAIPQPTRGSVPSPNRGAIPQPTRGVVPPRNPVEIDFEDDLELEGPESESEWEYEEDSGDDYMDTSSMLNISRGGRGGGGRGSAGRGSAGRGVGGRGVGGRGFAGRGVARRGFGGGHHGWRGRHWHRRGWGVRPVVQPVVQRIVQPVWYGDYPECYQYDPAIQEWRWICAGPDPRFNY